MSPIQCQTSATARVISKKKGFTLTEIAIVLGIMGLILGAIWTAAASVYQNQRITHANTAVVQIVQSVRTLMSTSSQVGTAGDITGSMVSAGVIPTDLVSGGAATGPWAGSTLKILTNLLSDTAFTVELNKVPKAACIALLTTLGGTSRDQGLSAEGSTTAVAAVPIAAGTAGTALALATSQVANDVTAANATTACSSATANLLQFEYTLK